MQSREKRRIVMHAFEQTWDQIYARFRKRMPAPAAEFASEEVFRRLGKRLTESTRDSAAVGSLLDTIVGEMLPPQTVPVLRRTTDAVRQSA